MIKITLTIVALALFASQVQSACNPPCKNNQPCVAVSGVEKCSCSSAWAGTDCGLTNPCASKPCKTNGACFTVISGSGSQEQASYYCQCYSGFSGVDCQTPTTSSACASNPCLNGGVCSNVGTGFSCTCVGQYTGQTCGTYIDLCAGVMCQNGGICKPDYVNQKPVCDCLADFYGPLCEFKLDNCINYQTNTSVCQNGATCLNLIDGYVCQCAPGYTGDICNIGVGVNPCNPNPCPNGKICSVSTTNPLGYECSCPAGYFGTNACVPDPCVSRPCLKGKCVPVEGVTTNGCTCPGQVSYICICNPGDPIEYAGNC